jgi:hypothetical protein
MYILKIFKRVYGILLKRNRNKTIDPFRFFYIKVLFFLYVYTKNFQKGLWDFIKKK